MTDQLDLDAIQTRAADVQQYGIEDDGFEQLVREDVPALIETVRRLRAELAAEQAHHATTLRQRNNRSERLMYLRDVAKSGQTGLLVEEALNTLAASVNDHLPADTDEMAASLRRDGFGDDEIADILGPDVTPGEAPEPTLLRWGLDDVMWGDDDSVTVMLSGPEREPYWLKLDPERAAVLRELLAGPDSGLRETVHACPPDGSGLTPCCERTPFELPSTDRMSNDPTAVTCHPAARSAAV